MASCSAGRAWASTGQGPSRVLGEGEGPLHLWWSLVLPGLCKKSLDAEWAGASGQALQESPPQ